MIHRNGPNKLKIIHNLSTWTGMVFISPHNDPHFAITWSVTWREYVCHLWARHDRNPIEVLVQVVSACTCRKFKRSTDRCYCQAFWNGYGIHMFLVIQLAQPNFIRKCLTWLRAPMNWTTSTAVLKCQDRLCCGQNYRSAAYSHVFAAAGAVLAAVAYGIHHSQTIGVFKDRKVKWETKVYRINFSSEKSMKTFAAQRCC